MKTTQMEAQHTPLKVWVERDMDAPGYRRIKLVDAEQFVICELTVSKESQLDEAEKQADRIVKAVNSHEALIKGLLELRDRLVMGQDSSGNSEINQDEIDLINSLLALSEGE